MPFNNNWERALKPEEQVFVREAFGSCFYTETLHKVARVTETQVVLDDGSRFNRMSGYRRNRSKIQAWLSPATPEALRYFEKMQARA